LVLFIKREINKDEISNKQITIQEK
jgi:hypothetical protein